MTNNAMLSDKNQEVADLQFGLADCVSGMRDISPTYNTGRLWYRSYEFYEQLKKDHYHEDICAELANILFENSVGFFDRGFAHSVNAELKANGGLEPKDSDVFDLRAPQKVEIYISELRRHAADHNSAELSYLRNQFFKTLTAKEYCADVANDLADIFIDNSVNAFNRGFFRGALTVLKRG